MKKWMFSFMILSVLMLTACNNDEKEEKDTNSSNSESGVEVEKGKKNVEVTLPAVFFEGQAEEDIISNAKAEGIKEVKVNDDGSVYYKMSNKDHQSMLDKMKGQIDGTIKEIETSEEYPSVKEVKYNDDLTEFNIKVSRKTYEEGFESFAVYSLVLGGMYYNIFNGIPEDKVKIKFNFIDEATNEVYETSIYPDDLEDKF